MADKKKINTKPNVAKPANKGGKGDKPSFAYQLIPYIVAVVSLFLLVCFIANAICNPGNSLADGRESEHVLGIVGFWLCQIVFGIFGPAAYLIPAVLACFVIFWKNYNKRDFVLINIVVAVFTVVILSALYHVFAHIGGGVTAFTYDFATLFEEGARSAGGGVIGGIISFALVKVVNIVGALFVLIAALIPMITFLVGTTPVAIVTFIVKKIKAEIDKGAPERQARKEAREEEKRELRAKERQEREEALKEERARKAEEREEAKRLKAEAAEAEKAEKAKARAEADEAVKSEEKAGEDAPTLKLEEEPEEKMNFTAFEDGERKYEDSIKSESSEKKEESVADEYDGDEDEKSASEVFADEPKTVVFSDPKSTGSRVRGHSPVDDLMTERFDDEEYTVNKETGEVFKPKVQDKGFKSADEFRQANEQKDEYFIGEKPEIVVPEYVFPKIDLLESGPSHYSTAPDEIEKNKALLRGVLADFKINVTDITCSCGPTITRYEVKPEAGVRVRQIANLVDDIAYGLAKSGIRIEAPIPGKAAVGIEVPNDSSVPVKLRTLIEHADFISHKSKLASCLGADVAGRPVFFDIEKMPHLLVAGTTGSGKSVCINSIIMSILYHAKPEDVKLLLIDPKKVEFKVYKDIPHLCCRIISDPKRAAGALNTAVNEMEKRFELIEEVGVRNIAGYNEATKNDPDKPYMPRMVIIIDEFADLMMTARDEVETAVVRIAQKARAAGIHLIIGTQRPSVDVITGLIKANIPSRIAFTVMSGVDSRTILDTVGAEKLCGRGDMLYAPVGAQKPQRVQGAFVSDEEVERVVEYVKANNAPVIYDQEFESSIQREADKCGNNPDKSADAPVNVASSGNDEDAKFWDAVELAIDSGKISTSLLQRRLSVGYGKAAKLIDRMEEMGFVSAPDGNKPRKILITREELEAAKAGEAENGESEEE